MAVRLAALTVVLAALGAAAAAAPGSADDSRGLRLRLAAGTFRPLDESPAPPAWFTTSLTGALSGGPRYLVAITRGPLSAEERSRLEAAGAELLDYLPDHAYRIRVTSESADRIHALPFVAWLGELPAWYKIEPRLARQAEELHLGGPLAAASAATGDAEFEVRAVLFEGESEVRVAQAFADFKTLAAPSGKDGAWRVVAAVPALRLAETLSAVAALPEVEAIEEARRFRPLNQDAVWVHQSFVGPSPQQTPVFDRGIFGCGQIVAIADTGQDYDSCFFRDTVNGPPPIASCAAPPCPAAAPAPGRRKDILYYNWSGGTPTGDDDTCPATLGPSGHGTHTSGSIAGDTSAYANCATFASPGRNGGDGEAPGAKLVIQELGDGLEYLNNLGGTVWNLTDVAFQNGARTHSNSWGGGCVDPLGQPAS